MRMSACIDEVAAWMRSNRLQLNTTKTEFLWSTTSRRLHQLPQLPLRVGSDHIAPASVVQDLGVYIDSDVSMRSHVDLLCGTASTADHPSVSVRSLVASVVSRPLAAGLRQCDTGQRFITSLVTAAVSDEHHCSAYFLLIKVLPAIAHRILFELR